MQNPEKGNGAEAAFLWAPRGQSPEQAYPRSLLEVLTEIIRIILSLLREREDAGLYEGLIIRQERGGEATLCLALRGPPLIPRISVHTFRC